MKHLSRLSTIVILGSMLLSACSPASLVRSLESLGGQQSQDQSQAAVIAQDPTPAVNQDPAPAASSSSSEALAAFQGTLEDVYAKVSPSVVNIQVATMAPANSQTSPFGFQSDPNASQTPVQSGLGSGFVWDKEGHIVTNNHVVADADKVTVTFSDGLTVPGKIVAQDPYSDLAVVKVDVDAGRLHPVQVADSGSLKVGQAAIAIGNPFGLEGTMTFGIISALGRSLPVNENTTSTANYQIPDVIQTDAPINPGNSGGVLVNDLGQLVGVTAAIESSSGSSAGIGFAIPSNIVEKVVPSLIDKGAVQYPWLGIEGRSMISELAQAMNLNPEQRGALVAAVTANGPADKAGLQGSNSQTTIDGTQVDIGGDVITAINGTPINTMDDLISYLVSSTEVGQTISLTILRDGKEQTIEATLEPRPNTNSSQQVADNNTDGNTPNQASWIGIAGETLTNDIIQSEGLNANLQGVYVKQVLIGGPASQAGIKQGDVIVAINDQPLRSMPELRQALSQFDPGSTVTLTINRGGQESQAQITLAQPLIQIP
ncbi:MAG TPA: trypsin-like peptidase domain-containing protein [Anaerolineaceae bacterium]|nr:trypsin-like peptidase domain-containing protein [Anaerolineaceae bacterium]